MVLVDTMDTMEHIMEHIMQIMEQANIQIMEQDIMQPMEHIMSLFPQ